MSYSYAVLGAGRQGAAAAYDLARWGEGGRQAEATVEMIDYADGATGFSAMERCTGWSAAIVAAMMARGQTPRGAGGVETCVPAQPFVQELRRRGIRVTETLQLS